MITTHMQEVQRISAAEEQKRRQKLQGYSPVVTEHAPHFARLLHQQINRHDSGAEILWSYRAGAPRFTVINLEQPIPTLDRDIVQVTRSDLTPERLNKKSIVALITLMRNHPLSREADQTRKKLILTAVTHARDKGEPFLKDFKEMLADGIRATEVNEKQEDANYRHNAQKTVERIVMDLAADHIRLPPHLQRPQ